MDSGFHDVTLVNIADTVGHTVPVGDLSLLRRQWPVSVMSGMSRKQLELEQLCHVCKKRFCGAQTGCSRTVARTYNIIWHDMYPATTLTWASCGGAQCRGAPSGRALHRIVSIIFRGNIF